MFGFFFVTVVRRSLPAADNSEQADGPMQSRQDADRMELIGGYRFAAIL